MTKKITYLAMLSTVALLCGYIEMCLPNPFQMQGIKLGLANSVIMISIYLFSFKEAYCVSVIRVFLTSVLFGNLFAFGFSLAGCTFSIVAMHIGYRSGKFSIIGNSILGAVFHNIGQLVVAMIVLDSIYIIYYFAALLVSGVITGFIVGNIAQELLKRINRKAILS